MFRCFVIIIILMSNIVELKNISKSFGKKEVLKNINLEIKEGSSVSILGTNGSGKSTLINVVIGLLKQTKGTISYPLHNNSVKEFNQNMGIQFQSGAFPSNYKVREVIEISIEQSSTFSYKKYRSWKKEANKKIDEFLNIFQIKKLEKAKVSSLSGGEKQRLNILLAIISKPSILILDEISTGLDIASQKLLINFIKDYVKENNVTLIIISHIVFEIEELTDRIYMLNEGVIEFEADISKLISKHKTLSNALEKYFIKGEKVV